MRHFLRFVAVLVGTSLSLAGIVLGLIPALLVVIGTLFAYAGASKETHG